jgi:hypothetical protein
MHAQSSNIDILNRYGSSTASRPHAWHPEKGKLGVVVELDKRSQIMLLPADILSGTSQGRLA